MKAIKIFALAFVLMPMMAYAGSDPKDKSQKNTAVAEQMMDIYPMFDNNLAANLWDMWRRDDTQFTQEDYTQVIDLCIIAFDYINAGYNEIIDNYESVDERLRVAADLDDIGKSSIMVTFARTFSNRMQHLAADGVLNEENLIRIYEMLDRKAEFKRLVNVIHC